MKSGPAELQRYHAEEIDPRTNAPWKKGRNAETNHASASTRVPRSSPPADNVHQQSAEPLLGRLAHGVRLSGGLSNSGENIRDGVRGEKAGSRDGGIAYARCQKPQPLGGPNPSA